MRIKDREKYNILPEALDYSKLRELGIKYLQEMTGNLWRDFNPHDPGVTILELLCYSLVDLGYRTSFEMRDLLTKRDGVHPETDNSFFQAHEILPCGPVTMEDYRKLIMESLPSVRNVTFKPVEKVIERKCGVGSSQTRVGGFYRVLVELNDDCGSEPIRRIVGKDSMGRYVKSYKENPELWHRVTILNLLLKHRNLCENFRLDDVVILKPLKVGVCANIEIKRGAESQNILSQINERLQAYVSPSLRYHSLSEMVAKGKTPEEIYQAENPKYGFIDRDELRRFEQRRTLYTSDVLALIMGVDGVKSVSHLNFIVEDQHLPFVNQDFDCSLSLCECDDQHALSFQSNSSTDSPLNRVTLFVGGLPLYVDADGGTRAGEKEYKAVDVVYPLPDGTNRQTDRYYSIQELFPEIYKLGKRFRLGEDGLSKQPKAFERLQLKAYLLIFEQLIADYQAQLTSIGKLLSWETEQGEPGFAPTYSRKVLSDDEVADFSLILDEENYRSHLLGRVECDLKRRGRVLDHLLARFGEEFEGYSIRKGTDAKLAGFCLKPAIGDKCGLLSNYAQESLRRTQSIDYTDDFFDYHWEYSPVEKRIMRKLGIDIDKESPPKRLSPKYSRRRLKKGEVYYFDDNSGGAYKDVFGIHIIEHVLLASVDLLDDGTFLRLSEDRQGRRMAEDPYTMQLTVVVPGWLDVCQRYEFRLMVEKTITDELPAHVAAKVCWVDPYVMMRVEDAYDAYLKTLKNDAFRPDADGKDLKEALAALVSEMDGIRNIYPPVVLGLGGDANRVVRLNYSALGEDGCSSSSGANWRFKNATKNVNE